MEQERKLAKILVNYSCSLKSGEKVMVEVTDVPDVFLEILLNEIYKVGAYPFVIRKSAELKRQMLQNMNQSYALKLKEYMMPIMKDMDAYISIRGINNKYELCDVNQENIKIFTKYYQDEVVEERVNNTKWVILNYPTSALAQEANLSSLAFKEYFYLVCNLDYEQMDKSMNQLKELMEKTDKVHIVGNGTDLTFSIKGMPAIKCAGKCNIPDGEVYTAPIKDSVNGVVSYTIPSIYDGKKFENIKLKVKDGKIIEAESSNTAGLNFILDTDEGARYFGEFSLGVNPYIKKPMLDILFDEKMFGSFHLTPGRCYEDADNTNQSSIHWDMVCCQTKEYGGGDIYFDDVLIRHDGLFVLPSLKSLNFAEPKQVD